MRLPQFKVLHLSPTTRITLGLISLLVGLLMVLDLVFKLLPDQRSITLSVREQVSVHMALQVRQMLAESPQPQRLVSLFDQVVSQSDDVRSIGVRLANGKLVAQTAQHPSAWQQPAGGLSTITHVVVPLNTPQGRWGQLEVAFTSPWATTLIGFLQQPTVQLVGLLSAACFVAFYLYLRRVLQHLDPSKAIPERVRVAFDTLTEGLIVLDLDGHMLMVNEAFRNLHPSAASASLLGKKIDQQAWLLDGIRGQHETPPWQQAIESPEPIIGVEVDLSTPDGSHRRVLMNCAAIKDAAGNPRGCLVTLDDVTALDRANAQLRQTLTELHASRDKIQQQNDELQKLANCDPMTGCFNRRAFFNRAHEMMTHAQASGEPLSCLMSDIDKFKNFNDTYGHAVGDLVIQQVSRLLKRAMRPEDVLCRYGGEEFCILLPGMKLDQAARVAEGIRAAIEAEAGSSITEVSNLRITSSFGVAQLGKGGAVTLEQLIDRADQGLYVAKESGRNQVQSLEWQEAKV
jgi:diguanylate cyclase (GGDEF)-like protein/PAS domain S-box-containing protein